MYFNSCDRVNTVRRGQLRARQKTYVSRVGNGGGGRHLCGLWGGIAMGKLQLGELGIVEGQISFNRQESRC